MLSVKVQYAIKIIKELKNNSTRITLNKIARKYNIKTTQSSLFAQVAGKLSLYGIIESRPGPQGGYRLEWSAVSLADILKALDEFPKDVEPESYDFVDIKTKGVNKAC